MSGTRPGPRLLRIALWAAAALAAAVAAVLAVAVLGLNRLPGPQLVATNGVGDVTVGGVTLPATDTASIDEALRAGVPGMVFDHPGKDRGGLVELTALGQEVAVFQSRQYGAGVERHRGFIVLPGPVEVTALVLQPDQFVVCLDRLRVSLECLLQKLPGRVCLPVALQLFCPANLCARADVQFQQG